mmetsp:Transcript_21863/g.64516  ORF Transcript_21863/g.64516 Transcript_21863/m.64516 type:complete len:237 (+) Transcript_21863:2-712(+)
MLSPGAAGAAVSPHASDSGTRAESSTDVRGGARSGVHAAASGAQLRPCASRGSDWTQGAPASVEADVRAPPKEDGAAPPCTCDQAREVPSSPGTSTRTPGAREHAGEKEPQSTEPLAAPRPGAGPAPAAAGEASAAAAPSKGAAKLADGRGTDVVGRSAWRWICLGSVLVVLLACGVARFVGTRAPGDEYRDAARATRPLGDLPIIASGAPAAGGAAGPGPAHGPAEARPGVVDTS